MSSPTDSPTAPSAPVPPPAGAGSRKSWGLERPGLALSLGGTHGPDQARRHRGWVEQAETLGLHSVWLPEMHFQPGVCPAPLVELAGYAATTRRLRIATTSLLLPLHPPEQIGAEIAALDQLSRGRLLISLGRGFQKPMLDAFEVPPAEKRDRFDHALERILRFWATRNAEPGTNSGATYQRPHPPLAVAAFGPKGLAQAARHGLPYLASPVETFDQIADNQTKHREGLSDPTETALSLVMRTIFVSENPTECENARAALETEMHRTGKGMPAAVKQAMAAPLGARVIVGNREAVTARLLRERRRLGLDLLVIRPQIPGLGHDAMATSLTVLAEDVWPTVLQASS